MLTVSGFFTSPADHDRILSGDASEMRMALNESGFFGFSKRLKRSSIIMSGSYRQWDASGPRPGAGPGSRRPPQALARAQGQRGDAAANEARMGRGSGAEAPAPPPAAPKPS